MPRAAPVAPPVRMDTLPTPCRERDSEGPAAPCVAFACLPALTGITTFQSLNLPTHVRKKDMSESNASAKP